MLAEPEAVSRILVLARELSVADRQFLAQVLRQDESVVLPEYATPEEALAFFWPMRVV